MLAEPATTAVASVVFGIRRVRPTAEALARQPDRNDPRRRISAVTATVARTATAGAVLSFLRWRSGSLVAPVLLHLAANCPAPLASALARTLER